MINFISTKTIIRHILNGTLETNLCRICLKPFGEVCENIFTQFWFENKIFSIADILRSVCRVEFTEKDNYNVCANCITDAFTAYNFHMKFQSTTKLLEDYVNEINECTSSVDKISVRSDHQLFLKLTQSNNNKVQQEMYDIQKFLVQPFEIGLEEFKRNKEVRKRCLSPKNNLSSDNDENEEPSNKIKVSRKDKRRKMKKVKKVKDPDSIKEIVRRVGRTGYGRKLHLRKDKKCNVCKDELTTPYQLMKHQKMVHNQNYCEICSDFYKDSDLDSHLEMHGSAFCCDTCKIIIKQRDELIYHIYQHQKRFVCYKCGFVAKTSAILHNHMSASHSGKGLTCKYCGKVYTQVIHFEHHVAKHEVLKKNKNMTSNQAVRAIEKNSKNKIVRRLCSQCGADFVDKRALKMHVMRVHTGERPFKCEECGNGYVSKSTRDAHARRAHQPPSLCCPICHYLFHSKSQVSSHVKVVHLKKGRKRGAREVKQVRPAWPTTVVPFNKLRIDVQRDLLEMFRSGEMDIPDEYLNDTMFDLLKQTD